MKKFTKRAAELALEEDRLKASLDPDVRAVLQGKRLLLFKEMAEQANVGDETLFQELISGFSLTGHMPESKQFPAKLKPALISGQQLRESSVWANHPVAGWPMTRRLLRQSMRKQCSSWPTVGSKAPFLSNSLMRSTMVVGCLQNVSMSDKDKKMCGGWLQ